MDIQLRGAGDCAPGTERSGRRTMPQKLVYRSCKNRWDLDHSHRPLIFAVQSLLASEGSANVKVPKKFPSPEDERLLVTFYAASIRTIIAEGMLNNGRSLPSAIEGVAITFLKRFYLRTSVLEWHPKVIM